MSSARSSHGTGSTRWHAARTPTRRRHGARTLFTRASPEHAAAVLATLPDALHEPGCGLLAWFAEPPEATGGRVLVVAAGTAGLPRSVRPARP